MKKAIKNVLRLASVLSAMSVINSRIKVTNDFSEIDLTDNDEFFYDSKEGKIRYRIDGVGEDKPKMLLIHSLMIGGSLSEFNVLAKNLSEDFEVYRFDMLGYGHSDKPNIKYNSYLYTTLINDFINEVIKDNVFIMASGNSGDFSFLAREFGNEKIKHLFLVNPNSLSNTSIYGDLKTVIAKSVIKLPIVGTFITNMLGTRPSIKKYLLDKCYFNPNAVTEAVVNEYFYNAHYNCNANRFSLAYLFTNFLKVDIKDKLLETEKETTIILGENCTDFESYNIKKKLDKNRNIRTMIVPLSREMVANEKPNEVYEVIINHL